MPPSDTSAWVASRIRDARDSIGLTQRGLAERLGVTQTAVSYWEAAKRTPSLDDLLDLSAALERDVTYFLPDERSRPTIRAVLRAATDRLDQQELYEDLQSLLEEVESAAPLPRLIRVTATRPSAAAKELLEQTGAGAPPVDIEALANAAGVRVFRAKFDDALSGLVMELQDRAAIVVNSAQPMVRQRFTTAHELGHYVLAHHDIFHIDLGPNAEHGNPPGYDWRSERAANEFAADLLMPAASVHAGFKNTPSVFELAKQFEVSELAMGYRLADLGLR